MRRKRLSVRSAPAAVLLAVALCTGACEVGEEIESTQQAGGLGPVVSGPVITAAMMVKLWENHDGGKLWSKVTGLKGAVVVLYPAKRGWGAYLFAKKSNGKTELLGNYQGKIGGLQGFLGANVLEWEEIGSPTDDLNHGILGSIKKKPPKGPGDPPGDEFKQTHAATARALAEATLSDLDGKADVLRVEL